MSDFNPYTFDYKSYMKEIYGLNEMPIRLPQMSLDVDAIDNSYFAKEIEEKYDPSGTFHHGSENLRVYKYSEENKLWISLLSESKPILAMEYVYQRISTPINGIINLNIWNFKLYHGLFWDWFKKEIIPNESTIISDKEQTDRRFNFWKRLFQEYVKNSHTHKMYVIDFTTGKQVVDISKEDEMDKYFQSQQTYNLRFVLQKL
jgi:hypothetical protein